MQIVLVLVVIFFSITTSGSILTPANFNALIAQNAYVYVLATGMMMCMLIKGNIDLSVGAVVCFVDAIGAQLMVNKGFSFPLAMFVMLLVGLLIGAFLGYLIAYVNVPPWIATLAGFLAFRGWGTAVLNGNTIGIGNAEYAGFTNLFNGFIPDLFGVEGFNATSLVIGIIACIILFVTQLRDRATKISKGYEADSMASVLTRCIIVSAVIILFTVKLAQNKGIPFVLVWVAVIALIYNFITSKTTLGRYFYVTGGNMEATRLSGIDTRKVLFFAYLNMQFLTVIASWITMARLTAANPTAGTNYELDAISGCIVGGVSAYGGSGSVFGMIVGATLIGVINLGMSIMGIDANWQKIVKGLVLLAAVVFEILNNKDKTKA
ncbi:MAG: sugar ABC transporter permease [Lachnospiraceae bacterium]|nr:sugar ABC transporter permease [Lachnospiraceae bacterium]